METLNWDDFITKEPNEQVEIVNKVIKSNQNMTVGDISEKVFKQHKSAISKHLGNLGYVYKDKKYVLDESKSNQKITNDYYRKFKSSNDIKGNQLITLNMYSIVNDILSNVDNSETVRTTVKMSKEISDKLDAFMKQHKILNKQDIVGVAIELFLREYS